jgi:hypothetical protein
VPVAVPPITQRAPPLLPQPPQPQATPSQVPIAVPPITQQTPSQVPLPLQPQPTSVTGLTTVLAPGNAHRNALTVHAPDTPRPATSGAHPSDGVYSFEFIEPGLQNRKVKVYRTRDAAEAIYKDTIPLDQGGFQLIVIGTRNPEYVH